MNWTQNNEKRNNCPLCRFGTPDKNLLTSGSEPGVKVTLGRQTQCNLAESWFGFQVPVSFFIDQTRFGTRQNDIKFLVFGRKSEISLVLWIMVQNTWKQVKVLFQCKKFHGRTMRIVIVFFRPKHVKTGVNKNPHTVWWPAGLLPAEQRNFPGQQISHRF